MNATAAVSIEPLSFLEELRIQRWDDHRYYHHNLVNQSLHVLSALSFLAAYAMLFWEPGLAAVLAWTVAMTSRQIGHFFFEPKGYDAVNQATHEHKEAIKVGYNLRRKVVLMAIWALSPVVVWVDPTVLGLFAPPDGSWDLLRHVGQLWLAVGLVGLLARMVHLFFIADVATGVVWVVKIVTDPFHDIKLYHKAPWQLLRGMFSGGEQAAAEAELATAVAARRQR